MLEEEESPPPASPSQPSEPFVPFQEEPEPHYEQENDLLRSDSSRKFIDVPLPSFNSFPRRSSEEDDLSFENPQFFVELK